MDCIIDGWSSHTPPPPSLPPSLPPSPPYFLHLPLNRFINNMFSSYMSGQPVKTPPLPHDGSRTKTSDFRSDPSSLCTRFTVTNDEDRERVHYTIQDTPGFGDDTDIGRSIEMITDHIDESNKVGAAPLLFLRLPRVFSILYL